MPRSARRGQSPPGKNRLTPKSGVWRLRIWSRRWCSLPGRRARPDLDPRATLDPTVRLRRGRLLRGIIGLSVAAFALARPIHAEYWPVNDVHLVRYLTAAAEPGDGIILSPSGVNLTAFYGDWPVELSATTRSPNAVPAEVMRDLTLHLPSRTAPARLVDGFVNDAPPPRIWWYVAFRTGESVEVLRTLAAHAYIAREVQETRMGPLYLAVRFPEERQPRPFVSRD